MTGCWKGVALVVAWLGLCGTAAWGQYPTLPPGPIGAARMPEPIPAGPPKPVPEMMPGPISPLVAPPGPCPDLNLPVNHSSAFQCENFPLEEAWFASVGATALQRQGLGNHPLAVLDPSNIDTGFLPPFRSPQVQNTNQINPALNLGVRGTVGYLWNNQAIEFTATYVFNASKSTTQAIPGQIDGLFTNAPFGFSGDNGLFLQADVMRTTHTSELGNAEINYRRWNGAVNGLEFIFGVRYSYVRDKLSIFTDDDGLTFPDVFGNPDPLRQATYVMDVKNNIIAPQIGFEYQTPLPTRLLDWIYVGGIGKAAVGPNILTSTTTLTRGDGFSGFNSSHTAIAVSQVYELNGFVDFHILDRARLRAGYTAMWFVDVGTAPNNLNLDLGSPNSHISKNGNILYHGPYVELQFLF